VKFPKCLASDKKERELQAQKDIERLAKANEEIVKLKAAEKREPK
jgi:hypothetical protein